ncbi:MAG: hypothetical protein HFE94_05075 [Acutalibacter sp.]|nr:hypothetical protein [Acutalibacter sp.]
MIARLSSISLNFIWFLTCCSQAQAEPTVIILLEKRDVNPNGVTKRLKISYSYREFINLYKNNPCCIPFLYDVKE